MRVVLFSLQSFYFQSVLFRLFLRLGVSATVWILKEDWSNNNIAIKTLNVPRPSKHQHVNTVNTIVDKIIHVLIFVLYFLSML